jgi:hypothetical protein
VLGMMAAKKALELEAEVLKIGGTCDLIVTPD